MLDNVYWLAYEPSSYFMNGFLISQLFFQIIITTNNYIIEFILQHILTFTMGIIVGLCTILLSMLFTEQTRIYILFITTIYLLVSYLLNLIDLTIF